QQNESALLCKLVRDRKVELAIIRLPLELENLSVLHLHSEPFYFITSNKVKTFGNGVSLNEIQKFPLLLPSTEGLGVHYLIKEAFSRSQLHPNIVGECSDITLLMDLISSDFGASIVPETIINRHVGYPIQACKISNPEFVTSVGLIWLKNHYLSKAAQNFVELMKEKYSI
ncbi:MAG: LysR family transcriptional regulator substrate-binding protein, partial [Heyndrickxia sp.]